MCLSSSTPRFSHPSPTSQKRAKRNNNDDNLDNLDNNRQQRRAQKGGKTKQKIARVAGARLEVKEHEKVVEIRGGARECARAREYVDENHIIFSVWRDSYLH